MFTKYDRSCTIITKNEKRKVRALYNAHIREDGTVQTVAEHLAGTASLSETFASRFGEGKRGALLGMAHDIGKNSREFQKRLKGGPKVDHATAGAIECGKVGEMLSGCCVMGHHGGLLDFGNRTDMAGEHTYIGRVKKGMQPGKIPAYEWKGTLETGIPMPNLKNGFEQSMWVRMLYSCLVDADYLDTESFMTSPRNPEYDTLPVLLERLMNYIKPWFPATNHLNRLRCGILERCMDIAASPKGLFSLTVPTGGGKTVSSLAFALKHAVTHGMDRIIYVIPYTSIIEQNAKVFREILGEQNVIEHHSGVACDEDGETSPWKLQQRLATENWDAPVIVTTAVQFFESLYSNLPSKCRKLHNIANSVIIFDEAQMIPGSQLKPCVGAISNLVSRFQSTAVLCTATQPVLEDLVQSFCPEITVTEICSRDEGLFRQFQRVTYRNGGKLDHLTLAELLSDENQVLCIVNTRKMAQRIYGLLPEEGSFHLSTLMYPKHRTEILDTVRKRLKEGLPCRLVSTSLIEAGVDIDFPAVYRQMTGLDSLIQAAGRCNREGKRRPEDSIVTYFEGEDAAPLLQRVNIGAAREVLRNAPNVDQPETIQRYFSVWRSLVGDNLDKSNVVEHMEKGIRGCMLPFETVAKEFHMIDQNTKTVYIPAGDGKELCESIQMGTANRQTYRQAGQYCVNIYEQHFQDLVLVGDVRAIDENSGILINLSQYDQQKGLSLGVEFGKGLFE